jgi:Uma2 family endonuclease
MSTLARLSVAEYEQIVASGVFDGKNKRRIELVCGELRSMNPIGSEHAMVVDRLAAWSFTATPRDAVWIRVQNPVALPDCDSEPEPDLVWAKPRDYAPRHPTAGEILLLIEVAESSLDFDRGEKADLYAAARIIEYWIINLVDHTIDTHRDPHDGHYRNVQSFGLESTVAPTVFPDARLRVATLCAPRT